jgi:hypothetical protein
MHPILTDEGQAELRRKYPPFRSVYCVPDYLVLRADALRRSGSSLRQACDAVDISISAYWRARQLLGLPRLVRS